jgi:hypothetical protein
MQMRDDKRNIFAREVIPSDGGKIIFLAGPTPRSDDVSSWRPAAVELLRSLGYDGYIIIPEERGSICGDFDYDEQIVWETTGLTIADVIVFWIPRDLENMPGFTTNDEWGMWKSSGKVVFGAPVDAPKTSYQLWWARRLNVPTSHDLKELLKFACTMIDSKRTQQALCCDTE